MRFLLSAVLLAAFGVGHAQDLPALLQILRQAERFDVRGEVTSSVYFPPRANPTRTLDALPRVEFVPWLVRRNFTLGDAASDKVAGRDAKRFDLTPSNANASRWSIWVDVQWHVPLAYEERSPSGDLIRRASFERVQDAPRRRPNGSAARLPSAEFRRAVLAALPGLRLPSGFEPVRLLRSQRGLEIALSDGINVLALVIADRNVRVGEGVFARKVGARFVWLVGNLPEAQLRLVLGKISAVQQDKLGTFVSSADSNP
ncbi:outer membrane lipoprotein-sorting protein [Deinococcus yavapaiensis]|uniref:MucB/RseB-like sigma(E) regulatory protein n=1 Tax=Deinococcus yavapaiensis KR-236 TaxID=694435 RepID=A0A318S3F2_9DEIO|nr:outer membrane lipoprotein-sorting protein [Deinococcus yavapaiensis]PYE48941.1 hypothetical protein DES52_1267 [Deinococcus yavapaiensis KR-236]